MCRRWLACFTVLTFAGHACSDSPTEPAGAVTLEFDFSQGAQGWSPGLADYPVYLGPLTPVADYRPLPPDLGTVGFALFIDAGGMEGVFAYYTARVNGLRGGQTYDGSFAVRIATDTPRNCVGIGGPPGEGTYVKLGASAEQPVAIANLLGDGWYRMNINKGDGGIGGPDALVVGNVANSVECRREDGRIVRRWEFKDLSSSDRQLPVRSAQDGSLWLLMGTDAQFPGSIPLYYTKLTVRLTPR